MVVCRDVESDPYRPFRLLFSARPQLVNPDVAAKLKAVYDHGAITYTHRDDRSRDCRLRCSHFSHETNLEVLLYGGLYLARTPSGVLCSGAQMHCAACLRCSY